MLYFIYNDDIVIGFYLNNVPYFYVKNTQNDILAVVDQNNNIVASYKYDSWGNPISILDENSDPITAPNHIGNINPFRYRSYYYDSETGLYYLNSRYYNPQWKRFINPDGIIGANEDIIGYNLYSYVSNNPINMFDPNGNIAWLLPAMVPALALPTASAMAKAAALLIALSAGGQRVIKYTIEDIAPRFPKSKKEQKTNIDDNTIVYRYGNTNPGNLVPKSKDINTGLSFSLAPPLRGTPAGVTTLGALKATGVLNVKHDGIYHVSVTPKYDTMQSWINTGVTHPATIAIQSVIIKWDGR